MSTFCTYRNLCWLLLATAVVWGLSACDLLGGSDNGEEEITIDLPGKIVFSMRAEDGNNQIFTINAEGSDLVQRTFQDFEYEGETQFDFMGLYPSWSPEGDKIIFNSFTGFSALSIWIMESDSLNSGYTIFNEHGSQVWGNQPKWHPDGTRIVYFRPMDFADNPFLYTFATQEVTVLGHDIFDWNQEGQCYQPHLDYPNWSPDGQRIVFYSNIETYQSCDETGFDLFIVDGDGSNLQNVTNSRFSSGAIPLWNPNGQELTFRLNDEEAPGLYQVDIDSGEIQLLVSDDELDAILLPLSWSGDGNYLLVNNQSVLEILDINNKHLQTVYAAGTTIHGADWFIEESSN